MKTMFKTLVGILAVITTLAYVSCQKENEETILTNDTQDYALAERFFDDLKDISEQSVDVTSAINPVVISAESTPMLGNCVTITHDSLSNPRRIIVDYGTVNCLCRDGRLRRGQIIITYTGRYIQPGTVITHTFNNYFVNDNHVQGTKVVTNKGLNSSNNMWWTMVDSGTITKTNGAVITFSANRQREWIAGMLTPRRHIDDVFLIRGSSSTTRPDGRVFTVEITNDLRKELSCRWFVSGTVEMTPANRPKRILDYGNGTCDNIATVTVNGVTRTIELP